jgi:hypothetical protein
MDCEDKRKAAHGKATPGILHLDQDIEGEIVPIQDRPDSLPGRGVGSSACDGASRKIDLLIASPADVCFVKFIRENFLLLPAIGTLANECFQILKLFEPGAVEWRTHGNLPFRSASKELS